MHGDGVLGCVLELTFLVGLRLGVWECCLGL